MTVAYDLVCLSHLRWNFVYQRPQHLMSRAARDRRVFFIEEPIHDATDAWLETREEAERLHVIVPHLPSWMGAAERETNNQALRQLVAELFQRETIERYLLWYYTPIAVGFCDHLQPLATVYDCMDELSAFAGAPRAMRLFEATLFERAELVFAGGPSLFEAKCAQHPSVHLFPSSVDAAHFRQARRGLAEPGDQAVIRSPRLGYFGVLDERLDRALLAEIADRRPEWQLVMIGPVAKISRDSLPQPGNIHYLGMKPYAQLPAYLAGWDVAMMPFALNDSTRFISPTKTPEYLAAGKPVVSTPIRDVIRPYGELGLVQIACCAEEFVEAAERALNGDGPSLEAIDAYLATQSWDRTWEGMSRLIDQAIDAAQTPAVKSAARSGD